MALAVSDPAAHTVYLRCDTFLEIPCLCFAAPWLLEREHHLVPLSATFLCYRSSGRGWACKAWHRNMGPGEGDLLQGMGMLP